MGNTTVQPGAGMSPSAAAMLSSLGSTQDAEAAGGNGRFNNIQDILQRIARIVATIELKSAMAAIGNANPAQAQPTPGPQPGPTAARVAPGQTLAQAPVGGVPQAAPAPLTQQAATHASVGSAVRGAAAALAGKGQATLEAAKPAMSVPQAIRVLTDNFPQIQSEDGLKLADLKKIAKGEQVNGMKSPPSAELQSAARTATADANVAGGLDTLWQRVARDGTPKPDGVIGKDDLLAALSHTSRFAAGEKEALQTLDKHKSRLMDKNDLIDMKQLAAIGETGKMPDGSKAPEDLTAAAKRVASSPWLSTALDNGFGAGKGEFQGKLEGDGRFGAGDLTALLNRANGSPAVSAQQPVSSSAATDLASAAKREFGADRAKQFLTIAAKASQHDQLPAGTPSEVAQVVKAAKDQAGPQASALLTAAAAKVA
jgi:hypothetical protein